MIENQKLLNELEAKKVDFEKLLQTVMCDDLIISNSKYESDLNFQIDDIINKINTIINLIKNAAEKVENNG